MNHEHDQCRPTLARRRPLGQRRPLPPPLPKRSAADLAQLHRNVAARLAQSREELLARREALLLRTLRVMYNREKVLTTLARADG